MTWDLGVQGLVLLGAIALGFGVVGGVLVGGSLVRRTVGAVIATLACFGAGLLTSEWIFGDATEEELQPNIDGLSRDEVLLSSLLTTVLVVVVLRLAARRRGEADAPATSAGAPAPVAAIPSQRAAGGRHRADSKQR